MHRFVNEIGVWLCILSCLLPRFVQCRDRVYYVAAVDVEWDYAPSGRDLVNPGNEHAAVFLEKTETRIGHIYTKAVYKQFTDSTYQTEIPKPEWLGPFGPILKGEEDDNIIVHFKNLASRSYTMHPHGVLYKKDSEGALYVDGTSGDDKPDDMVRPGMSHTYTWMVTKDAAPTASDPDCMSWVYHSHINPVRDTIAGLTGPLLTCKRGVLDDDGLRLDKTQDIVLVFTVFEEHLSWYIEKNIEKCANVAECQNLLTTHDKNFTESNLMHAVNGYMYGNLPGLTFCQGETVWWHLIGVGSEVDVHTVFFRGHTLLHNKHRLDTLSLFAGTFTTASMLMENPGQWLISCQVHDHFKAGMLAFMNVTSCQTSGDDVTKAQLMPRRTYYIAADEIIWDYSPTGLDKFDHHPLIEPGTNSWKFFSQANNKIGGRYKKVVYREYIDDTFDTMKPKASSEEHLGILGPVIAAEVGEIVDIVFKNQATRPHSIQVHGMQYESNVNRVDPGETHTYRFYVPDTVAPSSHDPDCLTYSYHSEVDMVKDINSGLTGPMLVCKQGTLNSNNRQIKMDREYFLMSAITDENLSWYIDDNINMFSQNPDLVDIDDDEFHESNRIRHINGFSFANLPGLNMCIQENISWHLIGQGSESDIHNLYFHGNTLTYGLDRLDTLSLFPDDTKTAYMYTDNPGIWPLVCSTDTHFLNGMTAYYNVEVCDKQVTLPQTSDSVRTYYIGVREIEWDYAPIKRDIITGDTLLQPQSYGYNFVRDDAGYIGSKYMKVVFREYTDATFRNEVPRTGEDQHLGLLGPTIRAEVGDTVSIYFRNMASRSYSLHSHGIPNQETSANSEGQVITGVAPGLLFRYQWFIPERSGPAIGDPNCIVWPYYSFVNPVRDKHSGLVGTLVVCRTGYIDRERNRRNDVDREFTLLFSIIDENLSWYIDDNIRNYAPEMENGTVTDAFIKSNKYTSINGYVYANNEGLIMGTGDRVAWYLVGLGNEMDIHTVHFHGQVLTRKTGGSLHRVDVLEVFPETTACVEMLANNPGIWLLHCHLNQHVIDGMETIYTVTGQCPSGQYGQPCTTCGRCRSGHPCRQSDGVCLSGCADGYSGNRCDQGQCPSGQYGQPCTTCGRCRSGHPCRQSDGVCLSGCADGYSGNRCDQDECLSGRYGPECAYACGQCSDWERCDQVTGRCPNGCQYGYSGQNCDVQLSLALCTGAHWLNGVGYNLFPGDCSKFVQCVRTEGVIIAVFLMDCSGGLHWDRELLVCNYPYQAGCAKG